MGFWEKMKRTRAGRVLWGYSDTGATLYIEDQFNIAKGIGAGMGDFVAAMGENNIVAPG